MSEHTQTPEPYVQVQFNKRLVAARVKATAALLSCIGYESRAKKLRVGFQSWDDANDAKNDFTLFFRWVGNGGRGEVTAVRVWDGVQATPDIPTC